MYIDQLQCRPKYEMWTCETESYVADELVTSRAGVRVRIGNTDAEGRMVMADVLCQMKEQVSPSLTTIHSHYSCGYYSLPVHDALYINAAVLYSGFPVHLA